MTRVTRKVAQVNTALEEPTTFDDWEHQICRTFVPLQARCPEGNPATFRGGVHSAALGAVTMSEVTASHAIVERTPRLIKQDDPELYKFGLQVSGSSIIEQDSRQACLQAGDFAIYDTSRPYRIAFSDDFRMTVAMFPRHLVQLPGRHMSQLTAVRLAGDSGLGSLISPLMRGLSADMTDSGVVIATHLGDAVVDLVTAAFAQQLALPVPDGSPAGHRALVAQVHRFIDQNLHDPDLSSSSIAAAHFVSVRHLQKVFEAEGESVSTLLRTRRLERCRRDLADPHMADYAIATVGSRWGFSDAAHFSRIFRSAFGASPREYRRMQRY